MLGELDAVDPSLEHRLRIADRRFVELAETVSWADRRGEDRRCVVTLGKRMATGPPSSYRDIAPQSHVLVGRRGFQSTNVIARSCGCGGNISMARTFGRPALGPPSVTSNSKSRQAPARSVARPICWPLSQTFARIVEAVEMERDVRAGRGRTWRELPSGTTRNAERTVRRHRQRGEIPARSGYVVPGIDRRFIPMYGSE